MIHIPKLSGGSDAASSLRSTSVEHGCHTLVLTHLTTGPTLKLWIPVISIDKQSMFLKITLLGQTEHMGV